MQIFPSLEGIVDPLQRGIHNEEEHVFPGRAILRLAEQQGIERRPKRRRVATLDRLGHAIAMMRLAVEAEREGQWRVADFWWRELDIELPRLSKCTDVWTAGAELAAVGSDADQFKAATLWSVFLSPALALFAGRIDRPHTRPDDRAFTHAARARSIAGLLVLDEADRRVVFGWTRESEIEVLAQFGRRAEAVRMAQDLVKSFPDHAPYLELLAGLIRKIADDELTSEKKAAARAKILKKAIDRLNEPLRTGLADLKLFAQLGHLHQARAVELTNADRLPDGLVAIATAQILLADDEDNLAMRNVLLDRMKKIQEHWQDVKAQLGARHNASLTAEGHSLKRQAEEGTSPMQAFEASAEAAGLRDRRRLALAKAFWSKVQLSVPTEGFDEAALALLDVVETALPTDLGDIDAVVATVDKAIAGDPRLTGVDRPAISRYLRWQLGSQEGPGSDPAAAKTKTLEPPPETQVPRLQSGERAASLRHPAAWMWFRSRQAWDVRLMAAATLLLVLVVTGATLWDARQLDQRDKAYASFQSATTAEHPDPVAVISAAQAFLASQPLSGSDPRTTGIVDGLGRALVLWLLSKPDVSAGDDQGMIAWARRIGDLPSEGGRK